MAELSNMLSQDQGSNFDTVIHDLLGMTVKVFEADGGLIRLYEENERELVIRAHKNVSENALKKAKIRRKYGEGRCWQSVLANRPLLHKLSDPVAHFRQSSGCSVIVPLLAQQQLVGTLSLLYREIKEQLDEKDINIFTLIGQQVGTALENVHLADELRKRNAALETLQAISQTVNQSLDLEQIFEGALDKIMEVFHCSFAFIRTLDWNRDQVVKAAQKGLTPEEAKMLFRKKHRRMGSIALRAVLERKVMVVDDLQTEPSVGEEWQKFLMSIGCRGLVLIPLFGKGRDIGLMTIGFREPHFVNEEELNLYYSIGQLIGTANENAGLYQDIDLTNKRFAEVLNSIDALIYVSDTNSGEILFINEYGRTVWGDVEGKICWQALQKDQAGPCTFCTNDKLVDTRGNPTGLYIWELQNTVNQRFYECRDRAIRWVDGRIVRMEIATDITERKRAEMERETLQAQFIQAQKMESVGRLAGGIAHDFNNMLGVITGRTELAMNKLEAAHPLRTHLEEIQKAAQRSADLTRQLLAFARKQVVAPEVLDMNDTVAGMLKMLRRLIGEDIDLAWMPGANLWPVSIDPAQIDQILVNLCVNARDAIAGVGKVTIETDNIILDDAYCADHEGFAAGTYVMLAVSDDGCGMDKDTLEHVFEPFFTTKGGEGTGLGLATVYGIVKQNDGFINLYSEPGKGTTFKIYLQACRDKPLSVSGGPARAAEGGKDVILLVEDEAMLLDIEKIMLEGLGYRVLTAETPGEAIGLMESHAQEIHLLITDVVLPEMSGKELSERIRAIKPGLRCLFMSGYTANVIAHRGVLDEGVQFIQKPFSIKDLAAKVRGVLELE